MWTWKTWTWGVMLLLVACGGPSGETLGHCVKGECAKGRCTLRWDDGTAYVGDCEGNLPHGIGVTNHMPPAGSEYKGQLVRGIEHGFGIKKYKNGRFYAGTWDNGKKHGKGEEMNTDGSWVRIEYDHGNKIPGSAFKIPGKFGPPANW